MSKQSPKPKSGVTKTEKDLIDFSLDRKKPVTLKERKLVSEINKIKKEGGMIEVPND